jgi:hypothetical protein
MTISNILLTRIEFNVIKLFSTNLKNKYELKKTAKAN